MKKILLVINIFLLLLLTACSNEKQIQCKSSEQINKNVELKREYIINYQKDDVTTLKTKEIIISDGNIDLNDYKKSIENSYKEYNKLDYYTNTITIENNNLISTTTINFKKININKFIELNETNKKIVKNKSVSVAKLKNTYEQSGCTCK